jgi:hypothetical protein
MEERKTNMEHIHSRPLSSEELNQMWVEYDKRQEMRKAAGQQSARVTRTSLYAAMMKQARAQFPSMTKEQAYAKYTFGTDEGKQQLAAYELLPQTEPDAEQNYSWTPPPLVYGAAVKRMDDIAKSLVKKGEVSSIAKGYEEAMRRDPSLYMDYLEETA